MNTKLGFDLSRVWKHFKDKNFGIISAYLSELSKKENLENQTLLKKEVREKGYGYKEIKGHWRAGKNEDVQFEYALFVPNISKEDIIFLGKKYKQFAVLYADKDSIILDKLTNAPNEVFTKMETGLKDGWVSWSEFKGHQFKFSEVEWEMCEPPIVKNWMTAMALDSYNNDKGITEYSQDLKRALLINKVTQKIKGG